MSVRATNLEQYLYLMSKHQYVEEVDGEAVMHLPCPFCAAKDWIKFTKWNRMNAISHGAMCNVCKRSARGLFTDVTGIHFEMIQCGGPDQPDWFEPKVRVVYNGNH